MRLLAVRAIAAFLVREGKARIKFVIGKVGLVAINFDILNIVAP